MPYVVTRNKPRKRNVDIFAFLDDLITLDMLRPVTKFETTGTKTFYYDYIKPAKLRELNIPKQIEILSSFYDRYKDLDICNGNPEYDHELQIKLDSRYNRLEHDEDSIKEKVIDELNKRGLKYNSLYTTFYIPKSSSTPGHPKWRRIDAPSEKLKVCLRGMKSIFEVLMDGCYYHTSAFAYISNRSAKDAVERHAKNKSNWFLKLDFSNFFGSTTLDFVMEMFSEVYPFSEIVKSEAGKTVLKKCLNLCFLNGGLPQGTPMSPLITNIMMIAIDHKISNGLKKMTVESPNGHKNSFVYTRYADDMMISNRFKFDYREVIEFIEKVLNEYSAPFSLNKEKTRFGSNAGENWVLGIMLNQQYKTSVGHKRKKRLKAMINNYMLDRANGISWGYQDLTHLQGEISYCRSIEKETIDRILTMYANGSEGVMDAIKHDLKELAKPM